MKKLCMILIAALMLTGVAFADSLTVNGTAAMGGSNFGLDIFHDNTSRAYVQDNTPDAEEVYRVSFLFNANNISPANGNWRQTLFAAFGPNPNPGVGNCIADPNTFRTAIRVFLFLTGGNGQNYNIQVFGGGNQCGEANTPRILIDSSSDWRICVEYTTGPSLTGQLALAVVPAAQTCPASGDAAYLTRAISNSRTQIDFVRLGAPQLNGFGRGESGSYYVDDFQSFRTLAP